MERLTRPHQTEGSLFTNSRSPSASPHPPSMSEDGSDWDSDKSCTTPKSDIQFVSERCPTYVGYIKTPADAILLLAACDLPDAPANPRLPTPPRRISRRLLDNERAALSHSGSIFVWDEREASMRRWTDGRCWSASRVSGCFLTYRELEVRKKNSENVKDGAKINLYKPDGLIKQSFSITTASNRKLHVISYFSKNDIRSGRLQRVSKDPRIVGANQDSWNVRVDEHEYGELLNRETEEVPNYLIMNSEVSFVSSTPYMGVKRSHEDDVFTSNASDDAAYATGRSRAPAFRTYDSQFPSRHYGDVRSHVPTDDMNYKRIRYDGHYSPPYPPHYSSQGVWKPSYEMPLYSMGKRTSMSPPMPPKYPSQSSYPFESQRPHSSIRSISQSVDAERGAMVALANLRGHGERTVSSSLPRPELPRLASTLRSAPRYPSMSLTDRRTLQKLSVPM